MPPTAPTIPTLRRLAERPQRSTRAAAKTISQVIPGIIVPAAADPAVLVTLHDDLRLSLHALSKKTSVEFADRYVVTSLATGFIELSAACDVYADPLIADSDLIGAMRLDRRMRLRLTKGIQKRLAVPVDSEVLVTCQPKDRSIRLLNLGTLADVFASSIAAQPADAVEGEVTDPLPQP